MHTYSHRHFGEGSWRFVDISPAPLFLWASGSCLFSSRSPDAGEGRSRRSPLSPFLPPAYSTPPLQRRRLRLNLVGWALKLKPGSKWTDCKAKAWHGPRQPADFRPQTSDCRPQTAAAGARNKVQAERAHCPASSSLLARLTVNIPHSHSLNTLPSPSPLFDCSPAPASPTPVDQALPSHHHPRKTSPGTTQDLTAQSQTLAPTFRYLTRSITTSGKSGETRACYNRIPQPRLCGGRGRTKHFRLATLSLHHRKHGNRSHSCPGLCTSYRSAE
jgi:hypothetical protein